MVTASISLLDSNRRMTKDRFIDELRAVSAGNLRALWLPAPSDTTTNILKPDGRVWTNSATIAGRVSYQGNGILVSFNGTDQYAETTDTASLSVGNGTADGPLSIIALANVTNTAASRILFSKFNATTTQREYSLQITAGDTLQMTLFDESSDGVPFRPSDAAITQGSLRLLGATYSAATGGATAANDITLYQDGALIASTANNAAGYVAMEDTTSAVRVGDHPDGGAPFSGSIGFVAVYAAELTAAQHRRINDLCREFYEVAL